jgi:hypothetical protein
MSDREENLDGWRVRQWLACLLLTVGCIHIFWEMPGADFVSFDDDVNFLLNGELGPLSAARVEWLLTEHEVMVRYVPVGWLLCCALTGINGLDPFWFHAASLALHAGCCVALYLFLGRFAGALERFGAEGGRRGPGKLAGVLPLLLAAWWGWHPLRVETVAWATTLIYVEATLLGVLSLYLQCREAGATGVKAAALRVGSLLLLCGALLSHPAAIALLPLHVIVELLLRPAPAGGPGFWRDRSWQGRTLLRLLPAVVAVAATLSVAMVVRQMPSVIPRAETPGLAEFGIAERVAQASATLVHFLGKTLWPADLNPAYTHLFELRPTEPFLVGSMLACAGLVVCCALALKRDLIVGLLALGTLAACVPFLGLQEHPFCPCDRYTQLPSLLLVCLLLTLAWGAGGTSNSPEPGRLPQRTRLRTPLLALLLTACLPAWLGLSHQQTRIWKNDETLHTALESGQDNDTRRNAYLARGLLKQLQRGERDGVRERLQQLSKNGPLRPELLAVQSELTAAEAPHWVPPFAHLLHAQALRAARQGELALSRERFKRALTMSPGLAQARHNLVLLLCMEGRTAEALSQLLWLRAHPGELKQEQLRGLQSRLASAYRAAGQEAQAQRCEGLEVEPGKRTTQQ